MAGDDEIDDPDALLDAATHVRSTGLRIDLVIEEAARVSLESLRARFARKTTAKKTIAVKVARGLQKLLKLETERFDGAPQLVCAGPGNGVACPNGRVPGRKAMLPYMIRERNGSAWRCVACANAAMTQEQRSERTRKANAAKTPEQRREAARKASAAMTQEQRSERARKANAAKTPEQLSAAARKRDAAMTPEHRSKLSAAGRKATAAMTQEQRSKFGEAGRKANAAMTQEQRSERARKANAARWSRRKPPPTEEK